MSKDNTQQLRKAGGLRPSVAVPNAEDVPFGRSSTATSTTTSMSTSSMPSIAATSTGSTSFDKPHSLSRVSTGETANESVLLTPRNQPIRNYEAIGLSPGSLKPFDEVQRKIEEDGILEEHFETMNEVVFRCIYFLYGRGYAWQDDRNDRIEKIRKFVEPLASRERLQHFACPMAGNLPMQKPGTFELYRRVALTSELFFGQGGAKGGFPRDPIVRFQRSSNCYAAASCVWCTLQWQKDMPTSKEACEPLDVGQSVRKFALSSDALLERRVLDDRGMSALDFASKLVSRTSNTASWDLYTFQKKKGDVLAGTADLVALLVEQQGKFGLVTNFHVYEAFKKAADKDKEIFKAAMENQEANMSKPRRRRRRVFGRSKREDKTHRLVLGYHKFDGFSGDTEGEFVHLDYDQILDKKQAHLDVLWKRQLEETKQKKHEQKQIMERNIPAQWRGMEEPTPKSNGPTSAQKQGMEEPTPPGSDGHAKHAMVLLGVYRERKWNVLTRKDANHVYFMLLNSWAAMPLVLVSPEYLAACGAEIHFLHDKLGEPPAALERDTRVYGECSFFDGGDDSDEASKSSFFSTEYDDF